jgi:hypothetical protein
MTSKILCGFVAPFFNAPDFLFVEYRVTGSVDHFTEKIQKNSKNEPSEEEGDWSQDLRFL